MAYPDKQLVSVKQARKKDALALAQLIYDIYKDVPRGAKIKPGQNNAKQTKRNWFIDISGSFCWPRFAGLVPEAPSYICKGRQWLKRCLL